MRYAVITEGLVENIILGDGADIGLEQVFHGKQLVKLDEGSPVSPNWSYAGGEFVAPPKEPVPVPPAPRVVTMRQARLALLAAGKLDAVAAVFATLPSSQRQAAVIEWEYAATVDRDSSFTGLLGTALKLDARQLDALFTAAAAL